jgi:hypothetical protein
MRVYSCIYDASKGLSVTGTPWFQRQVMTLKQGRRFAIYRETERSKSKVRVSNPKFSVLSHLKLTV